MLFLKTDKLPIPVPRSPFVLTMPLATIADLRQKLREMGEEAPHQWTCLQIKGRIAELKEMQNGSPWNQMQSCLAALKRASRKKADIVQFAKDHQVAVGANETIPQIYSKLEKMILDCYPPFSAETAGFGQFANKTYEEIYEESPNYVTWCKTISQEEAVCWRMQRFLKWIEIQESEPKGKSGKGKGPKGYKTMSSPGRRTKRKDPEFSASSDTFSLVSSSESEAFMKMKEELERLRQEKTELQQENAEMSRNLDRVKTRRET